MQGYGAYPGPYGDQGTAPPPQLDPQQQQDDIHLIREKYVGGTPGAGTSDIRTFNLAAGTAIKFDEPETETNSVIISVASGTAKFYLGDYTGNPGAPAHITVPAGGPAPQYMFETRKGQIYTVSNDPTAVVNAVGTLIIVRI